MLFLLLTQKLVQLSQKITVDIYFYDAHLKLSTKTLITKTQKLQNDSVKTLQNYVLTYFVLTDKLKHKIPTKLSKPITKIITIKNMNRK